jgi:hypothetical protein
VKVGVKGHQLAKKHKAAENKKLLFCPQCGYLVELWRLVFGSYKHVAPLIGVKTHEGIQQKHY